MLVDQLPIMALVPAQDDLRATEPPVEPGDADADDADAAAAAGCGGCVPAAAAVAEAGGGGGAGAAAAAAMVAGGGGGATLAGSRLVGAEALTFPATKRGAFRRRLWLHALGGLLMIDGLKRALVVHCTAPNPRRPQPLPLGQGAFLFAALPPRARMVSHGTSQCLLLPFCSPSHWRRRGARGAVRIWGLWQRRTAIDSMCSALHLGPWRCSMRWAVPAIYSPVGAVVNPFALSFAGGGAAVRCVGARGRWHRHARPARVVC